MSRVLLLGGEGYIGKIVSKYLIDQHHEIVSYDNLIYFPKLKENYKNNKNYEFVYGDIGNLDLVSKYLKKVDSVVILAGLVGDPITKKYPEQAKKINYTYLYDLINKITKFDLRTIFVSTCSNYGLMDENVKADENSILNPQSDYAHAKVQIEKHILSLKNISNFNATILRFATAFGLSPRMRFDLSINEFTKEIYQKNNLKIYDETTWRPYCHVKDFARLINNVINSDISIVKNEIFNAGSDENNFTKKNIVDKILSHISSPNIEFIKGGFDKRNYKVNFSKVRNVLGFTPKYNIDYGIDEIISFLNNNLDSQRNEDGYGNYVIYEK